MKWIRDIKNTQVLKKLYGEGARTQLERYEHAMERFEALFGEGDVTFFSTSGRSEIIGNHTDHNQGMVLAAGIHLDAVACARKTGDAVVELVSEGYEGKNTVDLSDLMFRPRERGTTVSLIRGIAYHMQEDLGMNIGGFKAYVTSDVLSGSGLSSSAAIEVLIYTIFHAFFNGGEIDRVQAAKTSQWAENNYFGKPCGLMDQCACALGRLVYIDFENREEPKIEGLDFDPAKRGYELMITDVHADHADLTREYAAITDEMRAVASFFGKDCLRQVNEPLFYDSLSHLRQHVSDRAILRAMHFFEENKRVDAAVRAIKEDKISVFLQAVRESGESSWKLLQNTHETGSTAQAMTLALALSSRLLGTTGACRVHGGGFGGTVLAFVPKEKTEEYETAMNRLFGENACRQLFVRPIGTTCVDLNE